MYKIALVCENGASTGLCMRKMIEAARNGGVDAQIEAFGVTQLVSVIDDWDCFLLGPQIAFKLDNLKKQYPAQAEKMTVIPPMDFGMLNGEKILKDAMARIDASR